MIHLPLHFRDCVAALSPPLGMTCIDEPCAVQVQAWTSILTNCLVFGFTSDQVMVYAPHIFRALLIPHGGITKVLSAVSALSARLCAGPF